LREYPVHTGPTSLGICLKNEIVEQMTTRWMKALGYRGILDIGYRYDARDGQYKLLDANPRIGATFRLFVARNGMDVARALYLDLTGQPVPSSVQRDGRKWMVEKDLMAFWDYRRERLLTFPEWLASFRGLEECGYFSVTDPVPFFKLCAGLFTSTRLDS
jgi:D-aspartate ligase